MAAYNPEKAINIVEDALLDNITEDNRFLKPKRALLKKAANVSDLRCVLLNPTPACSITVRLVRVLKFRLYILSRQAKKKKKKKR